MHFDGTDNLVIVACVCVCVSVCVCVCVCVCVFVCVCVRDFQQEAQYGWYDMVLDTTLHFCHDCKFICMCVCVCVRAHALVGQCVSSAYHVLLCLRKRTCIVHTCDKLPRDLSFPKI